MPKFSKTSSNRLETCHPDLQVLFNEVVKHFDCSIISGMRTPEEQNKLYQQGRTKPGPKVTNVDGFKIKSKHNFNPSQAVDVVPYPIDWNNTDRMKMFIGFVLGTAAQLKKQGLIRNDIVSGIDWDKDTFISDHRFKDHPHFQIRFDS